VFYFKYGIIACFFTCQTFRHSHHCISISPFQSTAGHRPLQLLAILFDLRLLASTPASRPAQVVIPPGLRASYTTFTEAQSPLQNSFTLGVVGSTAAIASPLPLQCTNTVCYVSEFSFLLDHLVSVSIPRRNPERTTLNLWTSRAVSVHVSTPYFI
jgi:hypothetical protein